MWKTLAVVKSELHKSRVHSSVVPISGCRSTNTTNHSGTDWMLVTWVLTGALNRIQMARALCSLTLWILLLFIILIQFLATTFYHISWSQSRALYVYICTRIILHVVSNRMPLTSGLLCYCCLLLIVVVEIVVALFAMLLATNLSNIKNPVVNITINFGHFDIWRCCFSCAANHEGYITKPSPVYIL